MLKTIQEKWPEILDYLKKEFEISDVSFKTWLQPLKAAAVKGDTLIIIYPDENMGLEYIRKKYSSPLKVSLEEVTGFSLDIEFIKPDQLSSLDSSPEIREPSNTDIFEKAGLNSKYTFSSFVVGENNSMAHAAALAVAESPAEIYNPLFIYGGVGLGKTHLMQSIAHFILSNDPTKKVLYVTCETFTNEIIEAIRNGSPMANVKFREKYRNCDVLLIDDIQFIAGKESSQQELFHTFNTLYDNNKQIIISSDKPPKEINNLEERLCSRFLWGLPVDIQSPNYETRVAILRKKTETEHYPEIPDEVINYIAENVSSNIRELEGALTKIVAFSKLSKSDITPDFAKDVLHDLFSSSKREVTPDFIIKTVAEHFGITVNDITSKKKSQNITYPRHICMYLCRTYTDAALSLIGKNLGNRDHSTVIHGCEKIQDEIEKNEKTRNDVEVLKKKILPV